MLLLLKLEFGKYIMNYFLHFLLAIKMEAFFHKIFIYFFRWIGSAIDGNDKMKSQKPSMNLVKQSAAEFFSSVSTLCEASPVMHFLHWFRLR